MGLSINYKGKLKKKNQLNKLVDEVKDIAQVMNWPFSELDQDWNEKVDAQISEENGITSIKGNCGLKGISFTPHPCCGTINLYFNKNGRLSSPMCIAQQQSGKKVPEYLTINTQFAGPETHMAIIKLMKHLRKKHLDLKVVDESKFWDNGNKANLLKKMNATEVAWEQSAIDPNSMPKNMDGMLGKMDRILKKT